MKDATRTLANRLSELSVKNRGNPYIPLSAWPETLVPEEAWHLSPKLVSLEGMPEHDSLDESRRKRLAFFEAINFYSLNIHGERSLMEGLASRLYRKWPAEHTQYIHHFLGEENNHMVLFGNFCEKYAGKVYPDRHLNLPREYQPGEQDFLFFAKVLIFEEIVDYYNYANATDQTLHPMAREINRLHREDEARHLAFGRKVTADLWAEHSPKWTEEKRREIGAYLVGYMTATLREYYSPDAYRDAGFENPYDLVAKAWAMPNAAERRKKAAARAVHFFITQKILNEEPTL